MKRLVKSMFNVLGIEVSRKTISKNIYFHSKNEATMPLGIYRAGLRGVNPATVFDVGAAEGKWFYSALDIWKNCNYVLMEPLEERKEVLQQLEQNYKNLHYVNACAGAEKGFVDFHVSADLDGSGIAASTSAPNIRKVAATTIDAEAERLKLKGPYVIKLDTHGFEVPILEGAVNTLKATELVIIECYGFKIAPPALLFWEMCAYMKEKGFRLIDVVDIMLRDKDDAFWQCDAFFIPENAPVFNSNTYI